MSGGQVGRASGGSRVNWRCHSWLRGLLPEFVDKAPIRVDLRWAYSETGQVRSLPRNEYGLLDESIGCIVLPVQKGEAMSAYSVTGKALKNEDTEHPISNYEFASSGKDYVDCGHAVQPAH